MEEENLPREGIWYRLAQSKTATTGLFPDRRLRMYEVVLVR